MRESDRQYFGRRAEEERACAASAAHPAAAAAHLELAERYGDLAGAIHHHERRVIRQVVAHERAALTA